MKEEMQNIDPILSLRELTTARIGLGRVGNSIPLKQLMEFKLAHAHARDAVYSTLNVDAITEKLQSLNHIVYHLHSQALSRHKYLKRPDHGRKLADEFKRLLTKTHTKADIAIIIADGLSATAVNENAFNLLKLLIPMFTDTGLTIAPICLVEQGRVAIGDDIGYALKAKLSIVLIGERPGLSSADSMGAYLTYNPKPGLTDEARNCISNIRKQGLKSKQAADKIFYLVTEALQRKLSGVALKDNAGLLST